MSDLFHDIWWADSRIAGLQFHGNPIIKSIITDPPFGINNKSNFAKTVEGKEYARKIENDETPEQAIQVFKEVMLATFPGMAEESDIYVFTSPLVVEIWMTELKAFLPEHGFLWKAMGLWEKSGPGLGDHETWGQGIEIIMYFKRGKRKSRTKKVNPVFHDPQVRPNKLIHPHEKPESLLVKLIEHSTDPGEFCYDPFGGSGSLVRAARSVGRSAIAVEYNEKNYLLAKAKLEEDQGLF